MTDLPNLGYVTTAKKETKKALWTKISGAIVIATFVILIYNTWFKNRNSNPPPTNDTKPASIIPAPPLDTNKRPAKRDSPPSTDTPIKQLKEGIKKADISKKAK